MIEFFIEFYENGRVVGELGISFIVLIPKKEGALSIRDFRPISLKEASNDSGEDACKSSQEGVV